MTSEKYEVTQLKRTIKDIEARIDNTDQLIERLVRSIKVDKKYVKALKEIVKERESI